MSTDYVRVQWTEHKKWYDLISLGFFFLLLLSFIISTVLVFSETEQFSTMTLLIRGFGFCAIVALHIILSIGPLARLDPRFAPLLYNRRHLGVMTFVLAFFHMFFVMIFYHGFGVMNPFVSLFVGNTQYHSLSAFPFELFGLGAFIILLMLALTSHDFWQKYFGKVFWKSMHMFIYLAYFFVLAHVLLGVYQTEHSFFYTVAIVFGFSALSILHLLSGFREHRKDKAQKSLDNWILVGQESDFVVDKAKIVCSEFNESIAVFKHKKGFSAVTNVCAHQGGPLGEGRVIDGCITCPWHGWQYRPEDGQSPPPFEEKISTYKTKILDGRVYVENQSQPPGTAIEPS